VSRALHRLLLVAALLSLAACTGNKPRRHTSAPSPSAQGVRKPPETSLPQDRRYAQDQDGEPDRSIDVNALPEPEPRSEPLSKYGNRSPYTVLGKSYEVLPTSRGYVERGIASWYGAKFHGYMTSSFEPYDMYAFSAAHKTLPLPSWVRVTNLANGKDVVVRVNDRGPFHQDRIIDLSYAAAARIGIWPAGTGRVEVRAIAPDEGEKELPARTLAGARVQRQSERPTAERDGEPPREQVLAAAEPAPAYAQDLFPPAASKSPTRPRPAPQRDPAPAASAPAAVSAPPAKAAAAPGPRLYLQVGAYGEVANAQRAADALTRAGLGEVQVIDTTVGGRHVRRVRLGPLRDAEALDRAASEVRRLGLGNPQAAAD
jgi:rare lipoprotein A